MKRLIIRTAKDPVVSRIVMQLAMELGFKVPSPEYRDTYEGLLIHDNTPTIDWAMDIDMQNVGIDVLDARYASINLLKEALQKMIRPKSIIMPFTLQGHKVEIVPRKSIHAGCVTIGPEQIEQMMDAYKKEQ